MSPVATQEEAHGSLNEASGPRLYWGWSTDDGRRSTDGLLRYIPHGVIYSSQVIFFLRDYSHLRCATVGRQD